MADVLLLSNQTILFKETMGAGGPQSALANEAAVLTGSMIAPVTPEQDWFFFEQTVAANSAFIIGSAGPLKDVFVQGGSIQPAADERLISTVSKNYFIMPARGWNWGKPHDYNAVDIAAGCGEPVLAAAEGLVVEARDDNYWNNGYGNYLLILHPTDLKTRYAHTAKNFVNVGDYVYQGQKIALIGNSGNTKGWSGCHLHFEVYGAKNPFAAQ